jgi:NTP pyrophosphatase (non-canonical NTP hydrolase)
MSNIEKLIGKPSLLEQLAEEATELAKAALKQARILRGENPTPVTEEEARASVIEEYTDVVHCAKMLDINEDELQIEYKSKRWIDRITNKNTGVL